MKSLAACPPTSPTQIPAMASLVPLSYCAQFFQFYFAVLVAGTLRHWNGLEKVEEMPHLAAHQSSLLVRGPDSIAYVVFGKGIVELIEWRRYSRTLRCCLIGSKVCGCYWVCFSCSPTSTP